MAKRRPKAWWFEQVAKLPDSGLTHRQFAEQLGVSLGTARHWIYAERRERRREQLPALVEVQWQPPVAQVRPSSPVRGAVGRVELLVEAGTDAAWLADVLGRLDREVAPC